MRLISSLDLFSFAEDVVGFDAVLFVPLVVGRAQSLVVGSLDPSDTVESFQQLVFFIDGLDI